MNDIQLDQLLKASANPAQPPADFQRAVWRRIEAEESTAWKPRAKWILDRIFGFLTLPPVAVATCAAMVALGVWFGLKPQDSLPTGEVAYIRSVSPFVSTHP